VSPAQPQRIGVTGHRRPAPISAPSTAKPPSAFSCLDRYLKNRQGDVKQLKPPRTDYRLRCGDYRLFFDFVVYETRSGRISIITMSIRITAVRHRREAYR